MTQVRDNKPLDLKDVSEHDLDTGLAEYLEGQSRVSALYQDESDAVPAAHIDSKVLFAARQRAEELSTGNTPLWLSPARWFGQGMLMPAAAACGVVGVASALFMLAPSDSLPLEPASVGTKIDGAPPSYNSPKLFVEEIQALRQSGNLDEADKLAREMQQAYPDQVVPTDNRSRVDD